MTVSTSIGSKGSPRAMFSTILQPMAEASKGCSGGCRARAMTRLNREGMAACQAGDYDAAARLLSEGVDLARRAGVSMYEAKMLNNLGLVRLLSERPEEAVRVFGRALTLVEGKIGRDNPLHARIEGNLSKAASLASA